MKKFFILLFCLFFFQLQALADNKFQREYENNEGFTNFKQSTQKCVDKLGKDFAISLLLYYEDEQHPYSYGDKIINELKEVEKKSKDAYKYINSYYLYKIIFYMGAFMNDKKKVFNEEIIVDDKEWVFLTKSTRHIILTYNILARANNPNPKAVINNSKQKEAEDENKSLEKQLKNYAEDHGGETLLREHFKTSKNAKDGSLMDLVVLEYKRLNEPGAPKEDISCYYLTLIMLNSADYTKRANYPKPIIVDNKDWKYLTSKTRYAIAAHNFILKVYNE